MQIGNKQFNLCNTNVMGIVNMSINSFYENSVFRDVSTALSYIEDIINAGVDIIDIGGQSTKPGFREISVEQEIENICNLIYAIKKHFDVPVSVDTYKYKVAKAAFSAGADMLNDVYGLQYDSGQMAKLISEENKPICIMHNKDIDNSKDTVKQVVLGLDQSIKIATENNIKKNKIIVDPGLGFGKNTKQNLDILNKIDKLKEAFNYPVLIGASNKSFIGNVLDKDENNRLEGSLSISIYAALHNVSFIRVHDVDKHIKAIKMIQAITKQG